MTLRQLASIVLSTFVIGVVSESAGEVLRAFAGGDQASHSEGLPCPDPADDGAPCGPSCACTCCPRHTTGLAFFAAPQLSLRIAPPIDLELRLVDKLHPKDVHHRIFHPPRSA